MEKGNQHYNIDITAKEPLLYAEIEVNHGNSHIEVKKPEVCLESCPDKPCTYVCPSFVYLWTDEGLKVFYERCVECGACKIACSNNNILLSYPEGGYGVVWKY